MGAIPAKKAFCLRRAIIIMSQCVASLHKLILGEEGEGKAAEIIACVCFGKQASKLRRSGSDSRNGKGSKQAGAITE